MAQITPTRAESKRTTGMLVSQLLTPEEPLTHSFSHTTSFPPIQTASPPASPEFASLPMQAKFEHSDDILYPQHGAESSASERPLFESGDRWRSAERAHSPGTESSISVPTPSSQHDSPLQQFEELPKPIITVSHPESQSDLVGPVALFNLHGFDYYRYCLAQSEAHKRGRMERKLPPLATSHGTGRDRYTQQMITSLGRSRVEKPRTVVQSTPRARVAKPAPSRTVAKGSASPALPKRESPAKRSRRQASTSDVSVGAPSQMIQPKPRTRAAPSKKIDDKLPEDWASIEDVCPPLSSLETSGKKLQVQWNHVTPLDLSNDPDRHQLHPQELEIASGLRLKCNQYLANKRRIFVARVTALNEGKEFNKTSAQTSTKIDVNKASRLWTAFDNVGWFDEKWFAECRSPKKE